MTNNGDSPAAVAVRKTAERCHAAIDRLEDNLEAQRLRIEELADQVDAVAASINDAPQPKE